MVAFLLGLSLQTALAVPPDASQPLGGVDVPLVRLPGGPDLGVALAASFLDYDGDGWVDLYVNFDARLWRNEGGTRFTLLTDLDRFLPPILNRYGAACGDFDGDGLPDIACEPRGDCFYLLRNLDGAGRFLEIARDPALVLDPPACTMWAETFCWADVDDDGDLDLWAPAYPGWILASSTGNQFFENLGATGPGGATRLARRTQVSGLGNPRSVNRPEGAQFADADRDGDLDGYANGALYQNVTGTAGPRFRPLVGAPTGIGAVAVLDEGALFLDHDLDGDQDLFVLYHGTGNVLWENEGDGTFSRALDAIESPRSGAATGCSSEDWDLDGDLDLTTATVYRENLLVENGQRFLRLATDALPPGNWLSPAWGDWDKDGDLDCVLRDAQGRGRLFRNTSYGPGTPAVQKRSVRVRVVRDSPLVARGLETEFGATVELRVHGDERGFVRRRFVASSHGYLQQSEYTLTMALPPGPDPLAPARGVVFDLVVDFPSLPANGILRVDRTVNPVLGALELAALVEREITVFRSGLVRIDGADFPPRTAFSHRLASTGALVLPSPGVALPGPVAAPAERWSVGMEVDTLLATGTVRVEELVLDGQLAPAGRGRCDANVRLVDVTPGVPGMPPVLVAQERLATSPRNDRSFLPLDWKLAPKRVYHMLCRVTELRASPRLVAAEAQLANRGALSFAGANPCDDLTAASAALDPAVSYLELRYRTSMPGSR